MVMIVTGVNAKTSTVYGAITPIVVPEMTSLEVGNGGMGINGSNSYLSVNSINPDLKIVKMVDIRNSEEVISYIVL